MGVVGVGANALLSPTGETVRAIQPANVLANAAVILVIYTLILGAGLLMLQVVLQYRLPIVRRNANIVLQGYGIIHSLRRMKITKISGNPLFRPAKRALIAAFTFMVLAPSLLATLVPIGRGAQTLWAFHSAVGLFAAGWLLVGATIRPYGSLWRGSAAAAIFYLLIGAVWMFGFNIAAGTPLLAILRYPQAIIWGTLYWPAGVAQLLGWFGLEIG